MKVLLVLSFLISVPAYAQNTSTIDEMREILNSQAFREQVACGNIDELSRQGQVSYSLTELCADVKPQKATDPITLLLQKLEKLGSEISSAKRNTEANQRGIESLQQQIRTLQVGTTTTRPSQRTPRQLPKKDPFWR